MSEDSIVELATAIILEAINNWVALDYGNFSAIMTDGATVTKQEVLWFFNSAWFEQLLLAALPETPPARVREALKIGG